MKELSNKELLEKDLEKVDIEDLKDSLKNKKVKGIINKSQDDAKEEEE
ncbi:hypothetical protein GO491_11750 [Flavobacteriaceae bacterium Ap0902]|nr:hypothetical protein [Flavobacteriaceae bacterium Ap0902]